MVRYLSRGLFFVRVDYCSLLLSIARQGGVASSAVPLFSSRSNPCPRPMMPYCHRHKSRGSALGPANGYCHSLLCILLIQRPHLPFPLSCRKHQKKNKVYYTPTNSTSCHLNTNICDCKSRLQHSSGEYVSRINAGHTADINVRAR